MVQTVTCRIVDCPDGRFAVTGVLGTGAVYLCGGLLTVAEADGAVETLQVLMEACEAQLIAEPIRGSAQLDSQTGEANRTQGSLG